MQAEIDQFKEDYLNDSVIDEEAIREDIGKEIQENGYLSVEGMKMVIRKANSIGGMRKIKYLFK